MPRLLTQLVGLSIGCLLSGCTVFGPSFQPAPTGPFEPPSLPPPPATAGELVVRIVYPPVDSPPVVPGETALIHARHDYKIHSRDSAFVFGSVGRADVELIINGQPVSVYPSGSWIAWLALPEDSVARFDLIAAAGNDTVRAVLVAPIAAQERLVGGQVWIDTASLEPSGDRWVRPREGVRLSLRATQGAKVRAITNTNDTIRFLPDAGPAEAPWGKLAFSRREGAGIQSARTTDRYVAWWTGEFGPDPDIVMAPDLVPEPTDSSWVVVEAILDSDTARARWPLRLGTVDVEKPLLAIINDDPTGTGTTDGVLAGRPSPWGTYHWFFPNGTQAPVSGRWNDQVRLQLSKNAAAWVDASAVMPLQPGTPPPAGVAKSLRLRSGGRSVVLSIPLPARIPFLVTEDGTRIGVRLYGVSADIDWIQYGNADSLVERIDFSQPHEDETLITVVLSSPLWGYRTSWRGNDLLVEVRRPPLLDAGRPLEGRTIAVDAGHPPGGATGPSGAPESAVTLEVARKVGQLLERYGARPILVRDSEGPMNLYERIERAEAANAELLVSIHANALPDGVNPFENSGTSVYYFHPRSVDLARELNKALVRQFGFRDLGIGRGDLAMVRPTWMPAALTEGLFLMLPDQEAVLLSGEGQRRYARGIVEGIAAFLRNWAIQSKRMEKTSNE